MDAAVELIPYLEQLCLSLATARGNSAPLTVDSHLPLLAKFACGAAAIFDTASGTEWCGELQTRISQWFKS